MTTTTTQTAERYLGVKDLAARWGEHSNTVYKRVATRQWLDAVRTIQLGRQLRFLAHDVDSFEEANRLTAETIAAALSGDAPAEPPEPIAGAAVEPPASEFGPRRPSVQRKATA